MARVASLTMDFTGIGSSHEHAAHTSAVLNQIPLLLAADAPQPAARPLHFTWMTPTVEAVRFAPVFKEETGRDPDWSATPKEPLSTKDPITWDPNETF